MLIGLVASLEFHTRTGARTRATKVYESLSQNHSVDLLNVSRENRAGLPEKFKGREFSATDQRLPGTIREMIAGKRVLEHCRRTDYDLVWSYNGWQHTPVISMAASHLQDIPLVVGVNDHRSGSGLKGRVVNDWLRKRIYEMADALVLESETLRADIDGLDVDDSRIILAPTGIDIDSFYEPEVAERDVPTIFYVGRDKDLDLLFESVPIVAEAFPQVECRLAGVDEDDYPSVTHERIEFLGYVSEEQLRTEMGQSHVCVVPYRDAETAGRPVKLLEYMSAEKCVVGTDLPFNAQMIRDGENGLLTKPTAEALAAGIKTVLGDPERRKEMAATAREDVRAYSLEEMQANLDRAVRSAVEN